MKKIILPIILSAFIVLPVVFATPTQTQAQGNDETTYTLLEPLPLTDSNNLDRTTTATKYIGGIFNLGVGIAGVLAVLMIIWGGFKYMTTDAIAGKNEARDIINRALLGSGLAVSAWLILFTVNPGLVRFKLGLTELGSPGGGGGVLPGYRLTPEQVAEDARLREELMRNKPPVEVNSAPCVNGETSGCTNIVGLPERALNGVMNLATNCQSNQGNDCQVKISGGTEGGHETHGPGLGQVDIRRDGSSSDLDKYITGEGERINPPTRDCSQLGPQYRLGGAVYVNEGNHWHVCY